MQKGQILIFILAGTVLIAVLIGGAYYLGRQTAPQSQTPQSAPSSVDASPAPTGAGVSGAPNGDAETANWKLYTNRNFLFSFNYPDTIFKYLSSIMGDEANLAFILLDQSEERSSNLRLYITVSKNPRAEEAEEINMQIFDDTADLHNLDKKTVAIDGMTGYAYYHNPVVPDNVALTEIPAVYSYNAFIRRGEFFYDIALTTENGEDYLRQNKDLFKKILSTFKFL